MFIPVAQWLPLEARFLPLHPAQVKNSQAGIHPDSHRVNPNQRRFFCLGKRSGLLVLETSNSASGLGRQVWNFMFMKQVHGLQIRALIL